MDFISLPSNPLYPPIKVPCLSRLSYDGHEFPTYAERQGQSITRLLRGQFGQDPETATFLQNWLFFGVLFEVLGERASKESYTELDPEDGNDLLTTRLLSKHLEERAAELDLLLRNKHPSGSMIIGKIEKCLKMSSTMCSLAKCGEVSGLGVWPLPPEIDLSIRALGHFLSSAIYSLLFDYLLSTFLPRLRFPGGSLVQSRLCAARWCPSDISMVIDSLSPASLYYICNLRRKSIGSHTNCSNRFCKLRQVDTSTYVTRHAISSCRCSHLGPTAQDVIAIIEDRKIPLVSIIQEKIAGVLRIVVKPYTPNCHYVAFSHVWSDGMGNPLTNSLPRCQILRLKRYLDELSGLESSWRKINTGRFDLARPSKNQSVFFWLDTLCIPVGEANRTVRSLAISQMKDTYEWSDKVLVLDSELESNSMSDPTEALMRITLSGWMRRLWTLQEGVLGSRLFFRFADGFFDVKEVHDLVLPLGPSHDPAEKIRTTSGMPVNDAMRFFWKMSSLRANVIERRQAKLFGFVRRTTHLYPTVNESNRLSNAIMEAFIASRYRSSSRQEDEFLCLGSLLALKISGLSQVPIAQRMCQLLKQRSELPQGLIFVAGERMKESGWKWAVNRFGNSGTSQLDANIRDVSVGSRDEHGFTVEYSGLVLPSIGIWDRLLGVEELITVTANGVEFRIRPQGHEGSSSEDSDILSRPSLPLNCLTGAGSGAGTEGRQVCVIFFDSSQVMASGIRMAAVILVAEEPTEQSMSVCKCDFEGLATVEILEKDRSSSTQSTSSTIPIDLSAQLVHRKWLLR